MRRSDLDHLDHEDKGEGEREDDEDEGEDGEGHGAHPRALLAPCTHGSQVTVWILVLQKVPSEGS